VFNLVFSRRVLLGAPCAAASEFDLSGLAFGPKNWWLIGGSPMKKFIHEENLKLFRKRLAETTNPAERQTLLKLLAEEEAKEPLKGSRRDPPSQVRPRSLPGGPEA
jgi:hypothetical protein